MTRKHFQLIADRITAAREYLDPEQADRLACDFAEELARTNPNFDRDRFLTACGNFK